VIVNVPEHKLALGRLSVFDLGTAIVIRIENESVNETGETPMTARKHLAHLARRRLLLFLLSFVHSAPGSCMLRNIGKM
jgi:hypothetical protein